MSDKDMVKCKSCEKDMPAEEDKCPHCGKDQRSFFGKYKILLGIAAMLIIVLAGSLAAEDKSDVVASDGDFIEISATELAIEYEQDKKQADATYKDELLEVTGSISSIDLLDNRVYVVLATKDDVEETEVQCVFSNDEEIAKLDNLSEDDSVVIQGEVHGLFTNVELLKCALKEES